MRDEISLESEDRTFEANYRAELIRETNERLKLATIRELRLVRRFALTLIDEPATKEVST